MFPIINKVLQFRGGLTSFQKNYQPILMKLKDLKGWHSLRCISNLDQNLTFFMIYSRLGNWNFKKPIVAFWSAACHLLVIRE